VRKEPKDVQQEKRRQEEEANRLRRKQAEDKNDGKARMKGKNRPSKRHRKKQTNVIEEKRPEVLKKMREEVRTSDITLFQLISGVACFKKEPNYYAFQGQYL
jgi:hypothetical protein